MVSQGASNISSPMGVKKTFPQPGGSPKLTRGAGASGAVRTHLFGASVGRNALVALGAIGSSCRISSRTTPTQGMLVESMVAP